MDINEFKARFHTSAYTPSSRIETHITKKSKKSAVLIPVVEQAKHASILLCKRPAFMKHHPNQICFPGGKVEPYDKSIEQAALRETLEELNIKSQFIQPIGQLSQINTLTGFNISPVVAIVNPGATWVSSSSEVQHAFTLPLSILIKDENWQSIEIHVQGKPKIITGFKTPYGLLWGATALLIKELISKIK